jgi:superoxide dismutase, Fe-Mn family
MDLRPQALPFDAASLPGLSERLVVSHHQNNYGGAVKRLNAIRAQLAQTAFTQTPGFTLGGLKREELVATNSALLHELYFASMTAQPAAMVPAMALALDASFGSAARWRDEFMSLGKALAGGSGWVLTSFLPREGTLVNQWAADHTHAIAGAVPLLALDMYEHAYHLDYGANATAYVDAFMGLINWAQLYARYQTAVHAASDGLGVSQDDVARGALFDVRRRGVFEQSAQTLPGAKWRDPMDVAQWAASLEPGAPVTVYCVYGHEVGRSTALRLRAAGVDARFLEGGIDAWARAGKPLADKQL